ncbi:hypothetical protein Scep_015394 [Stephania cephalantha]|uniref:Uncharacterized protein n=1 Tax=Stephania cephalantha TaxID=152367 RepID=A0AAP0P1B8_9MAGN
MILWMQKIQGLSGCEYFNWLDPEMTDRATIVINGLLRKLDQIENEKRLEDKFKGRRKLNGCSVAWWSLYCCLARLIGAELLFCVKLKPNLVLWLFSL